MRALVLSTAVVLCAAFANVAVAKKHKERAVRSNPGGASQRWSCEQLAESACDVAKRCEPDRSLRHCRKLRERCTHVKERTNHAATEDDVTVCAQAIADLSCKVVTFDNASGVSFEIKRLDNCATLAKDNPLPPASASEAAGEDGSAPKPDASDDENP